MKPNYYSDRTSRRQHASRASRRILVILLSIALLVGTLAPIALAQEETAPDAAPQQSGALSPLNVQPEDALLPPAEPSGQPAEHSDTAGYSAPTETADDVFSVRFLDYRGDPVGGAQSVAAHEAAAAPDASSVPAPDGQRFAGWDSDAYLDVRQNTEIYAVYAPDGTGAPAGGGMAAGPAPAEEPIVPQADTVIQASGLSVAATQKVYGTQADPSPTLLGLPADFVPYVDYIFVPQRLDLGENAGTYRVGAAFLQILRPGYTLEGVPGDVAPGLLTITKRDLTITVQSYEIPGDWTAPVYYFTYRGFVSPDNVSSITPGIATCAYAPGVYSVGQVLPIVVSPGSAQNYNVPGGEGTLTISSTGNAFFRGIGFGDIYYDGLPHTYYTTDNYLGYPLLTQSSEDGGLTWTAFSPTPASYTKVGSYQYRSKYDPAYPPSYAGNMPGAPSLNNILARPITITADSAGKTYDGTPLTAPGYTVTGGSLAPNETLSVVEVTGSQTQVGFSENTVGRVVILGSDGVTETTGQYDITREPGTLTVTAKPVITVTAGSAEKRYDGTPLTQNTYSQTGLPPGYRLEVMVRGSATDVADTVPDNNIVTGVQVFENATGLNVTADFDIVTADGTLTITPRPAIIQAQDASKEQGQDDPPLQATVTGNVAGETLQYSLARNPGETPGQYAIVVTEGVNPNYDVIVRGGTFSITAAKGPTPTPGPNETPTPGPNGTPTPGPNGTPAPSITPLPIAGPTASPPLGGGTGGTPAPPASAARAGAESGQTTHVGNSQMPLYGFVNAWALVNLILVVVTGVIMLALLITYFSRKKRGEDEQEPQGGDGDKVKRRGVLRLVSVLVTVVAVIVFALTEDMRLPMVLTDQWTLLMAVITLIQIVVAAFSRKKYNKEEDEQAQTEH